MAKKFIELTEAAQTLGISGDELNELREAGDVRAFRDGSTWKFKSEDLDQLAAKLKERGADDGLGLGEEAPDDGGDSILLSERELGAAGLTASSTIIGKNAGEEDEDEIRLADDSPSDVSLAADDGLDSLDLDFVGEQEKPKAATTGESGLSLTDESGLALKSEESSLSLASDSDLSLESPSDVTPVAESSDISLAGDDDLKLEGDDDDAGGSALELAGDDDEELVLGGGSDISSGVGDSGISLMDPADSGLDLEDAPLQLGSGIHESLELGEDEMILLGGEAADLSAATQLGSEEDFLLTPLEDADGDESGSGSQVIALDAEEGGFDYQAATMPLGGDAMSMLEEDFGTPMGAGATPIGGAMPMQQQVVVITATEAPYSLWNVLSLFVCVAVLCVLGIMMFDLVRNIWSWGQPYPVNSTILDGMANIFR